GAADDEITLRPTGQIVWRGTALARLQPGDDVLSPRLEPLPSELLDARAKERVRQRLAAWLDAHRRRVLAPLFVLRDAPLAGAARGLVFSVLQSLGTAPRRRVAAQVAALAPSDRRALARLDLVIGREAVFVSSALTRPAIELRALLFAVARGIAPPS